MNTNYPQAGPAATDLNSKTRIAAPRLWTKGMACGNNSGVSCGIRANHHARRLSPRLNTGGCIYSGLSFRSASCTTSTVSGCPATDLKCRDMDPG
jgi:hypothetical protein